MRPRRHAAPHEALYRALLVLYPRSFRDRYGEPMVQLFGDRVRDVGARAWLGIVGDLVRTVPPSRSEATMELLRRSTAARGIALALVAFGAALAVLGAGGGPAIVVGLALVGILLAHRWLVGASPIGERAPLRVALVQAWWAPLAALLGLAMVVAGVGTVVEADTLGGRLVGSAALLAFGGAMFYGLVRRPLARQAGNTLILMATIPAFPFFWLIVPTAVAIVVWAGVFTSGFSDRPSTSPASA